METVKKYIDEKFGVKNVVYTTEQKAGLLLGKEVIEILIQAQKDAYNQALEDAAENAKTRTNDESTSIIIDKQSIIKLKKP